MKFAMVTAHDQTYLPLADITWNQNKTLYAQKWGHDAVAVTEGFASVTDIPWARARKIIALLESGQYDWVHAVGCDTMITNFNVQLDDLVDSRSHFIIATDCFNINNDSFFARATPECIAWLKMLDAKQAEYEGIHPWNDQQCMIDHVELLGNHLRVVPQRLINAYDYDQYPGSVPHVYKKDIFGNDGQWMPGDFLIQWPGIPNDRRINLAQQMLTQVIK
jgi:hypothetical protein